MPVSYRLGGEDSATDATPPPRRLAPVALFSDV